MTPVIHINDVHKTYANGVTALAGVSLRFEPGEIVAILGPSGSGKSTLMRCVNGLERPTSGQVEVGSVVVGPRTLRQVRRQVGMIFQRFNLVPRVNVMANVLVGRLGYRSWVTNLFGWFSAEDHEAAHKALNEVKLLDRAWHRADKLSGGQQQRIGIARTLVQGAKVILADEPVASLDPETSQEVMRLLVKGCHRHDATLIVNLHQVELAKTYAKRIVGLRAGKVIFDKPVGEVNDRDYDLLYMGVDTPVESVTPEANHVFA